MTSRDRPKRSRILDRLNPVVRSFEPSDSKKVASRAALKRMEPGSGLTDRQRRIFEFIKEEIERVGLAPTYKAIGHHFRIRSLNGVRDHLLALQKKGYITLAGPKRSVDVSEQLTDSMTSIPEVACFQRQGSIISEDRVNSWVNLERYVTGGIGLQDVFCMEMTDMSLSGSGIRKGDLVVFQSQRHPPEGSIAVVQVAGHLYARRVFEKTDTIVLKVDDPKKLDFSEWRLRREEVMICGRVIGLVRRLLPRS